MERQMDMEGGGTLEIREQGANIHFVARSEWRGDGLYKVWLKGNGDAPVILGTLAPENGKLVLRRNLSRRELERQGAWPVRDAGVSMAFSFRETDGWRQESHPERLVRDPLIRAQLRTAVLCKKTGEGFALAAPLRTNRPVPLPVLFCLAKPERIGEKMYLVWEFDGNGQPVAVHKEKSSGHTECGRNCR